MLLSCVSSRCRIVPAVEERGRGSKLWVIKWRGFERRWDAWVGDVCIFCVF